MSQRLPASIAVHLQPSVMIPFAAAILACALAKSAEPLTPASRAADITPSASPSIAPTTLPTRTDAPPTPIPIPLSALVPGDYIGFTQTDPSSGRQLGISLLSLDDMQVIPFLPGASAASASPDGSKIAYLDYRDQLHIISAETHQELLHADDCFGYSTAWTADSSFLICGGSALTLLPADGREPIPLAPCGANPGDMNDCRILDWSPDSYYLAVPRMNAPGGEFTNLRLDIDFLQLECRGTPPNCSITLVGPYEGRSDTCDWLNNGRELLCVGDNTLDVLSIVSGEWRSLDEAPCSEGSKIAASPSQRQFACDLAADDGYARQGIGIVPLDGGATHLVLPDPDASVLFWWAIK